MNAIEKVFQEKEFVDSILQMTPEKAADALKERGVECTADDLNNVKKSLESIGEGVLAEESLQTVSGGVAFPVASAIRNAIIYVTQAQRYTQILW